ncbi:MAG: hypothetical protein ACR2P5_09625 [Gammaproteobacteria bacterium]
MKEKQMSDMRELAQAMNRVADAINQSNALIAEVRRENPDLVQVPELLAELNRQLRMIASRL